MKRRSFLSLLAAAAAAPALPVSGRAATAAVGYNRYTYGYAVFQARHGGAFGAADLAASMKVSAAQAQGMITEMAQTGVVRATANGAVEAVTTHGGRKGGIGFLRKVTETANDLLDRIASAAETDENPPETKAAPEDSESYGIHMEIICNSDSDLSA